MTRVDKTRGELLAIVGPYEPDSITYDGVYRSFLEEKRIWSKDSGRMYAHNIISWHEDEPITPKQALEFGKEFAEQWFAGFQSLVGVHIDRNHVHCHIITNSVGHFLRTVQYIPSFFAPCSCGLFLFFEPFLLFPCTLDKTSIFQSRGHIQRRTPYSV